MKRAANTLFVLSEKGSAVTQEGANLFLHNLGLPESTHIFYGTFYNDPRFLAGSLTQAENPVVAILLDDCLYSIKKRHDIQHFLNLLIKDGENRTSYEIFKDSIEAYKKK